MWQLSQPDVVASPELTAAPAEVMHAPPSGLSLTWVSAMNFDPFTSGATAGAGSYVSERKIGINSTYESLLSKSCSLRKSRSAG